MLQKVFFCFFVCTLFATVIRGANILVFMPMPIKSHFQGFQPLFEELSRRGHNLTVASSFPLERPVLANYTDIGPFITGVRKRNVMDLVDLNFFTAVLMKWNLAVNLSDLVMPHRNMKQFIQSDSYAFDLVMIEAFCQEYTVTVGHKFNAPVVNLVPAVVWPSVSKWSHIPSTFSYVPDLVLVAGKHMRFVDRIKNTIAGFLQLYVEKYLYLPKMKEIMNKHFVYKGWESRPPLELMLNNVSLTLSNSHYAVGTPRPYPPGVIEVGGMHVKEPNPLPENLQTVIDSAEHGVIYFSLGTIINLNDVPKKKLNIFLSVLGNLKQKVLMKWIPDGSVKLTENIMIDSWFPQNDILAHPNVRLFITHGGLHSLEETVFNAKPVVGIPFFADQYHNMKLAEENGYGKLVDFFKITEESFGNAIEEMLSNSTFLEKATIQSRLYRDQPMKPLDRAVYWVEYVIRNGGAQHLKSDSIGLNDLQYFLFDVLLVIIITIGLNIWLCYLIVKVVNKIRVLHG